MHTFWLALIVPGVILAQWVWPVMKLRTIWSISTAIVAVMTLGYIAMGIPALGPDQQTITGILTMPVFRCLSATDLPLIQLLIGCLVGWFRSNQTQREPAAELVAAPSASS